MQFYIHIGPGKTGTSVIQYELNNNINSLKNHGIFYPEQSFDVNRISNGNALTILDKINGEYKVNKDKIHSVSELASINSCTSILLSSESFYPIISQLISEIPNACYIAYIRNPISQVVSAYNQRVKRKGYVNAFTFGKKKIFKPLYNLNKIKSCHDIRLRSYLFDYDNQWNITNDLLRTIGSKLKIESRIEHINTSYSYEALEFKRRANRFLDMKYQRKLDYILQDYNINHDKYSLISIDEQKNTNKLIVDILTKQISITNHPHNLHKLVSILEKKEVFPYKNQSNQDLYFDDIHRFIASKDADFWIEIKEILTKL